MKNLVQNYFSTLPLGLRLFLLIFVLGFPVAWGLHWAKLFDVYYWLAVAPALVWHGQVWRVITYAFLPAGILDWLISLFWLATLVPVLGRNWTSRRFWGYSLLGALAGGAFITLLRPGWEIGVAGEGAIIFALLVAWDWMYRRERLILLGIGEISVRQAAILIAVINSLILFFCAGWFLMLAMWAGGVAGGLWLFVQTKLLMGKTPQQIRSERMARLEL
ncbi:MAG TPA: rhomboid family intramembrane serine protease [Candidatus Acidoferrum sp.]|nr:rhomboid family intramembrane serine protease [Candidatus Acidoferrum sp.]